MRISIFEIIKKTQVGLFRVIIGDVQSSLDAESNKPNECPLLIIESLVNVQYLLRFNPVAHQAYVIYIIYYINNRPIRTC